MIASTAAKSIGSTISLNAPSTITTMTAAAVNPTKAHDHTPILGIGVRRAAGSTVTVSRPPAGGSLPSAMVGSTMTSVVSVMGVALQA